MNIEQERADFEAWYLENNDVPHEAIKRKGAGYAWIGTDEAWEIWQAAQAALQSQEREDAERIQFMADEACTFNTWKQEDGSWKYRLEWDHGTEWQTEWFSTPEEAIDHAHRVEENE